MRSTASLLALTVLTAAACRGTGDLDPYAPLHQSAPQEIPGTFGYDLLPVEGIRSVVDPELAWRGLPGAERGSDVAVTLAEVQDPAGRVDWGPTWVFFTNDLCYFTAKGDFVSPARSGEDDGCTRENVLVQVVDATTGEFRAVFEAYDADLTWLPDRVGSPDQVPGATRFQ